MHNFATRCTCVRVGNRLFCVYWLPRVALEFAMVSGVPGVAHQNTLRSNCSDLNASNPSAAVFHPHTSRSEAAPAIRQDRRTEQARRKFNGGRDIVSIRPSHHVLKTQGTGTLSWARNGPRNGLIVSLRGSRTRSTLNIENHFMGPGRVDFRAPG